MPLPLAIKDRFLLLAGSNGGKTHQALWAAYHTIKAGKKVFALDLDDGMAKIGREVSPFTEIADSPLFTWIGAYDYDDALDGIQKLETMTMNRGDLVILEMVNYLWDWAQAGFSNRRYGKSATQHKVEDIIEKGKLPQFGGFDGRNEWPEIKAMYMETLVPSLRTPANTIWTVGAKDVTPMDKESIKEMFGDKGIRNEGQRDVHYQVDTIIRLDYDRRKNERSWTTVKDRGNRELQEDMPLGENGDLWETYYQVHGLTPPWIKK